MYQKGRVYPIATLVRILIVILAVARVSGTFHNKNPFLPPAPQQPVYYHPAPAPPPVVYHPTAAPRPPPQKPPQIIIVPVQTYPAHPPPRPAPVYPAPPPPRPVHPPPRPVHPAPVYTQPAPPPKVFQPTLVIQPILYPGGGGGGYGKGGGGKGGGKGGKGCNCHGK